MSAENDDLKELKTNFGELETNLAVSRNINKKLTQQLILVERKCWANEQCSRRECLEISGISESVQDDVLEDCNLKIINECDTQVDPANIEAYHRLKPKLGQRRLLLNFPKGKMCSVFYNVKRN